MTSGIDLFLSSEKVDLAAFEDEFSGFSKAVRLEMLPRYHVDSELPHIRDFLAGKPTDFSFNSEWYGLIRSAVQRGASMLHFRGLPDDPTPYLRFELAAYQGAHDAGEEFRFLYNHEIEGAVGEADALPDFWLFDDARAYPILYDGRGGVLGVVRADRQATASLVALVEKLKSISPRSLQWAREVYVDLRN